MLTYTEAHARYTALVAEREALNLSSAERRALSADARAARRAEIDRLDDAMEAARKVRDAADDLERGAHR